MWPGDGVTRRSEYGQFCVFIHKVQEAESLTGSCIYLCTYSIGGPGSSVGIATELWAGQSGIESRWGRDFPPVKTSPGGPHSLL